MRSRKPSRTATAKRARNGDVKPAHAQRASAPLITAADLRRAVFELASTLAPADVDDLLGSEDGWNDAGLSLARIFPLPGDTFSELTAQVFRGESEGLFEAPTRSDLSYLGHYRVYRDIGDDHNVEVGATWGRGHNGVTADSETTLENLHLVYRWRPNGRDPESGTRKYHNKTIRGSFREAQTYLSGKLQEREVGRLPLAAAISLNQYLDQWLTTAAKPRLR